MVFGISEHGSSEHTDGRATVNKARRNSIEKLSAQLGAIRDGVEELQGEEQEYLDAMPESLQGGEKGEAAQTAIDALEAAIGALEEAIGSLDEAVQ